MSQIQIMPASLADQIAAGEVVERPASVVKELVENAIDAGADQIDVAIEESGLKLIRVTDNGKGIAYDEVDKAFQRHATSKLLSPESLFRIKTLGFRGEALPSIASVSEVHIESAQEGHKGRALHLSGGEIISSQSASARSGTMIQVEDLFFNTPARLKHLKSMQTELTHITSTLNRFALTHPGVSFKLIHDGMTLMNTSGSGKLQQAIAGIYGVQIAKKMLKVEASNFNFDLTGYVSLPEVSRSNRSYMTIIVNDRYIKNYALARAIVQGYGSKLMVGRFPLAVIKIDMDPQLVDVNVHPTKDQVRISGEKDLADLITGAIRKILDQTVRIPDGLENINQNQIKVRDRQENAVQGRLDFNQSDNHAPYQENPKPSPTFSQASHESSQVGHLSDSFQPYQDQERKDLASSQQDQPTDSLGPGQGRGETQTILGHESGDFVKQAQDQLRKDGALEGEGLTQDQEGFPDLDYIGQMHGTYLFAQNEVGLYIIDQHAAQERIKYEYYREEIASSGTAQQTLLEPVVLDYPTDDYLTICQHKDDLSRAGIDLEDFGQRTFIVKSHPSWFINGQEEATIKEMIDFVLTHQHISTKEFREATAIMMSCKRSIKANHYLSDLEARALIQDLKSCQNPYNCPHGRPVMVKLTNRDMEKMFKRIQDR